MSTLTFPLISPENKKILKDILLPDFELKDSMTNVYDFWKMEKPIKDIYGYINIEGFEIPIKYDTKFKKEGIKCNLIFNFFNEPVFLPMDEEISSHKIKRFKKKLRNLIDMRKEQEDYAENILKVKSFIKTKIDKVRKEFSEKVKMVFDKSAYFDQISFNEHDIFEINCHMKSGEFFFNFKFNFNRVEKKVLFYTTEFPAFRPILFNGKNEKEVLNFLEKYSEDYKKIIEFSKDLQELLEKEFNNQVI